MRLITTIEDPAVANKTSRNLGLSTAIAAMAHMSHGGDMFHVIGLVAAALA